MIQHWPTPTSLGWTSDTSSRYGWLRPGVASLVVAIVVALLAPAPHGHAADGRAEQYRYAQETIDLTYTGFLARKADFEASGCRADRPKPGGCTKPAPYNAFDWTDDGCSGADQIGPLSNVYRNLFNKPCQLHDFGYRNFGKGLTLQRTETKRAQIDGRFLIEMRRVCNDSFPAWWQAANKATCLAQANGVYQVVRAASSWS